jgi:hypothetical protein
MNPPVAAAFDIQNALKLVDTAAQTYSPVPPRGGAVIFSRATDTRALVFADADDAVIAFRGTADLRNWLTDLQCDLRPWRSAHARVHHGFLAAWRSIRDETIQTVEDLGPKRRLWLSGFDALLADHYVRSYINLLARSPAGPIRNPTPKPQL